MSSVKPRLPTAELGQVSRRQLLIGAGGMVAAIAALLAPGSSTHAAGEADAQVTIVPVSASGALGAPVKVPRIVKTDAEWRAELSPVVFEVTRHAATERAFSGALVNEHANGIYRCVCCATALFDSHTKFESGTGWPSFYEPIARQNVAQSIDRTFGMVRTAVACRRCDAHLGHVFDDGPRPTGLRYCMNSASLTFAALEKGRPANT